MKEYDYVELLKLNDETVQKCISKGSKGIIWTLKNDKCSVIFFNNDNWGDYAFASVEKKALKKVGDLPNQYIDRFKDFIDSIKDKDIRFSIPNIKEYDYVELLVEKEKYSKLGVHKGNKGCVISHNAIQNSVEVDFTRIVNGLYEGACISVSIEDLKVL